MGYEDYIYWREIAQFLRCTTSGIGKRNYCKLAAVEDDSKKLWYPVHVHNIGLHDVSGDEGQVIRMVAIWS